MESVIFENSPLAAYLAEGGEDDIKWPASHQEPDSDLTSSGPSSPSFAPRGKPVVKQRFRQSLPPALRLAVPQNSAIAAIHETCSKAVNSRIGRADNEKFLERFRYIIVASQLLSTHGYLTQGSSHDAPLPSPDIPQLGTVTIAGAAATASVAFTIAWLIHWVRGGASSVVGKGRIFVVLGLLLAIASVSYTYMRRQWLQYLRQQTLVEVTNYVGHAQAFDVVATGALVLIQEVELVSRGYRISAPLPPVSRLEDRSQIKRCIRLRKSLRQSFLELADRYRQAYLTLKPYTQEKDLDKYCDVYDMSDSDVEDALTQSSEDSATDSDSLHSLRILAARLHTLRRIFLACLLALDAHGGKPDFGPWGLALDEIQATSNTAHNTAMVLKSILEEEETFPVPPTPKLPLSPGHERWRAQLRKLSSLSTGIRGLQAKLHLIRDEADKDLGESGDIGEFGSNMMIQYESIGLDLKALMQEWEDGKSALISNIDKHERRISSISGMLSPTISLGGLTAVEEGGTLEALRALNGEGQSRSSMELSGSDVEEVFEAIAMPRQRSTLTREERIIKMKEDRTKRESMKDRIDANTHMLRELESVINLRPRGRTTPAGGRITSI